MTIYDTLSQFFSTNKNKSYSRDQIYKKFKTINENSIHTIMINLAREKKIVPVHPRKWTWNSETL